MSAWIKQDLEQVDWHNISFCMQVFALVGLAYVIRLYR